MKSPLHTIGTLIALTLITTVIVYNYERNKTPTPVEPAPYTKVICVSGVDKTTVESPEAQYWHYSTEGNSYHGWSVENDMETDSVRFVVRPGDACTIRGVK